jgi:hypothetical protein
MFSLQQNKISVISCNRGVLKVLSLMLAACSILKSCQQFITKMCALRCTSLSPNRTTAGGGSSFRLSPAIPTLSFICDRCSSIVRGRGGLVLVHVCFRRRFLRFLCWCHGRADADGASRNNGLSQSMPMFVGGVADVGKRLVEFKLLSCHTNAMNAFLKCNCW